MKAPKYGSNVPVQGAVRIMSRSKMGMSKTASNTFGAKEVE